MTRFNRKAWKAFLADTRGVSTVEYALIVVAVVAIVGGGAAVLSGTFTDLFDELEQQIKDEQTDLQNIGSSSSST